MRQEVRGGDIVRVVWRQWKTEHELARRRIHFRLTDPARCLSAYAAMTPAEFEAINGRQDWANWRTIPRALSDRLPARPLQVLDLGCGSGGSTVVLAHHCPPGSRIIGYEMAAPLVAIARQRSYAHASGQVMPVEFVVQGITETLRLPDGDPVPDRSIDLVNASGVVGHHLTMATIGPVVAELRRVLANGGLALLDVGPTLRAGPLERIMEAAGFHCLGRYRSWLLDPNGQMLFARQTARSIPSQAAISR